MIKLILSHDFRHTAINQVWKLFSGPLLLVLVPVYLSPETQGYWFTFVSLAALVVFADMGFSAILLQFSAHEYAHLSFNSNKTLQGSEDHLIRIASLFRFSIKWSLLMAIVVFPIVLLIGFLTLNGKNDEVDWEIAWFIYGFSSIFVFLNSVVLSFIEGCESVGDVHKIRFRISLISIMVTVVLLSLGSGLYALAFGLMVGAFSGVGQILYKYRNLIIQLANMSRDRGHSWFKEIMSLLWRYAISWVSGYFIFSIFTPIAFHYYGAIEAGQIGLTFAIFTSIFAISNIWMTMVVPKVNIFIAKKDFTSLNYLFNRHLSMAVSTYFLGVCFLLFVLWLLETHEILFNFSSRLVSFQSLIIISIAWFFQVIVNGLAIYMRAFKKEPLVWISLVSGIYVGTTTWLAAFYLPIEYFFIGYLSSYLWVLPWVLIIFKRFKNV